MPHHRGPGSIGRFQQAISTAAGVFGSHDASWRRRTSPWFTALLRALTSGRGVPSELNGEPFRIDARYRVFLQPDYEAAVAAFLRPRVSAGQCALDIGAHIGAYALQMARWTAPGGRVIAFEPNPGTAAVLKRHLRMNQLENAVHVEQTALGKGPGSAALPVPVQTVDSYCAAHGIDPDWMLVYVEGYEFDVLAGSRETIARRGDALGIVIEVHPELWRLAGWSRPEAESLLASLGRRARPLTGQADALGAYGSVLLEHS